MALITGPERDGTWTTLAEEQDYLDELATLPKVEVTDLDPSPNGRPIRLVRVGQPDRPSLFVTSPHGDEPSGREGILQWVRNLAQATDPETVAYLDQFTVYAIPTCNPDGIARGSRLSGNWVDINRDHLALSQPETRNIARVLARHRPQIVLDLHDDVNELTYDTRTVGAKNLMVAPAIRDASQALNAYVQAELTALGRLVTDYPTFSFPSMAGSATGFRHALPLLSEVRHLPPADRALLQVQTLEAAARFHSAEQTAIAAAVEASKATKRAEGANPVPIDVGDHDVIMITPATSYELTRAQVEQARHHFELFNIEATFHPDGATINCAQDAYAVLPLIFDPGSPHRVITDDTLPEIKGVITGFAYRVDGVLVPATPALGDA